MAKKRGLTKKEKQANKNARKRTKRDAAAAVLWGAAAIQGTTLVHPVEHLVDAFVPQNNHSSFLEGVTDNFGNQARDPLWMAEAWRGQKGGVGGPARNTGLGEDFMNNIKAVGSNPQALVAVTAMPIVFEAASRGFLGATGRNFANITANFVDRIPILNSQSKRLVRK